MQPTRVCYQPSGSGGREQSRSGHLDRAYRWCLDADTPVADGASTLVTFTLTPDGDATRLTVIESGFAALPAEVREQRYLENTQGWDSELAELVAFAERPA